MNNPLKQISGVSATCILSYFTYHGLYMAITLLILKRHPERMLLKNYWLLISQSFLVMFLHIVSLIIVFNLLVGLIKNRIYAQPFIKRTIGLPYLEECLDLSGMPLFICSQLIMCGSLI
jgi:hypothetical protein